MIFAHKRDKSVALQLHLIVGNAAGFKMPVMMTYCLQTGIPRSSVGKLRSWP